MFDDCFVPDYVAVALRRAGYDEPCMATHDYEGQGKMQSQLLINYSNCPPDPQYFIETIREVLKDHPNLLKGIRKNSDLAQFHYAAPLYTQVFDWLFARGLRIHDCFIAPEIYNKENGGAWAYTIYEVRTGNRLSTQEQYFNIQRYAWDDAIINALKLLSNDKMDV